MSAPRRRSVLPLVVVLALLAAGLWLARKLGHRLEDWAREPSLAWALVGLAGHVTAAALAWRSFPLLRDARLLGLVILLLPAGLLEFLHHSDLLGASEAPGWLGELGPELQDRAPPFVGRARSWLFPAIPACALLACAMPSTWPVRRLRVLAFGLAAAASLVVAGLAAWGPDAFGALARPATALGVLALAAAVVAIGWWRTEGGLGGAVAGLCCVALTAGLAHLGVGFTGVLERLYLDLRWIDLATVELGALPRGTDRLLLMLLAVALAALVAREWIAELSHRTSHDALTRIYNKAYAEAIVGQSGAIELGGRFAVALADIDHFKKVNDTHGHGAGDVVLAAVAGAIRETVGARGVVCRTGGEEITVFFPFVPLAQAAEICEQVRRAVGALRISVTNNEGRRLRLSVTLSVGVAANADDAGATRYARVKDVVDAADRCVYQAKRGGRDRVVTDAGA